MATQYIDGTLEEMKLKGWAKRLTNTENELNSLLSTYQKSIATIDMLDFDYTQPIAQSQTFNMIIKYSDFEYEFIEAESSNWNGEVE